VVAFRLKPEATNRKTIATASAWYRVVAFRLKPEATNRKQSQQHRRGFRLQAEGRRRARQ
jgi:hypothetical protein